MAAPMDNGTENEAKIQNVSGRDAHRLENAGRRLVDPLGLKWPQTEKTIQDVIKEHLCRIFTKYSGCLRTVKKPPKWKKSEPTEILTEEEEKTKKTFRSWFVVGHRSTMKHLEKEDLRCMLVWSATSPPVLKQSLLTLTVTRGCPAAMIDDLLSSVCTAWPGLTSLTCLGILKTNDTNDFDDLVNYIEASVPKLNFQKVPQRKQPSTTQTGTQLLDSREITGGQKQPVKVVPPVVDYSKYYIKRDIGSKKLDGCTFSGQDFISFESAPSVKEADVLVESGKIVANSSKILTAQSFGIRPPLTLRVKTDRQLTEGSRKRPWSDSAGEQSGYVGLNIKNLKFDNQKLANKKDKKKKKKK